MTLGLIIRNHPVWPPRQQVLFQKRIMAKVCKDVLIIWVKCLSIIPSVRRYVHNETQSSYKATGDIGGGRLAIHDDMLFKVIRGQGQGHRAAKYTKMADLKDLIFYGIVIARLNAVVVCDTIGQYLHLVGPDFSRPLSFFDL